MDSLAEITELPLEGLSLALPHLLAVLADPKPFIWSDSPAASAKGDSSESSGGASGGGSSSNSNSSSANHVSNRYE